MKKSRDEWMAVIQESGIRGLGDLELDARTQRVIAEDEVQLLGEMRLAIQERRTALEDKPVWYSWGREDWGEAIARAANTQLTAIRTQILTLRYEHQDTLDNMEPGPETVRQRNRLSNKILMLRELRTNIQIRENQNREKLK